jgi:hypothetical protein
VPTPTTQRAWWQRNARPVIAVALLLEIIARTGNLMAARAVDLILLGAVGISWLSGTAMALGQSRARAQPGSTDPRGLAVVLGHILVVELAVGSLIYVAVMHEQLLDLLAETWHHGHDMK